MDDNDTDSSPAEPPRSPDRSDDPARLRWRAAHLTRLAADIERSLAMALPQRADDIGWTTRRAQLCEAMLERNLHQLHRAADDLRSTASRFVERADALERSSVPAA